MNDNYRLRPATEEDARQIAELVAISSDSVAAIEWVEDAQKEGCEPLDIGERTYRSPTGDYSWRNCIIAERDGKIAGYLLTFPIPDAKPRDTRERPSADDPDAFAPYKYLEEPGSWYVCGVALYPEHRGHGLGRLLMQRAEDQAKQNGYDRLSLVVFQENEGALRLYRRLGYEIADHAPVVPHPMIHASGEAYLMTRSVD